MIKSLLAYGQHAIFRACVSQEIRLSSSYECIQRNQNPWLSVGVERGKNLNVVGASSNNRNASQDVSDDGFHKFVNMA